MTNATNNNDYNVNNTATIEDIQKLEKAENGQYPLVQRVYAMDCYYKFNMNVKTAAQALDVTIHNINNWITDADLNWRREITKETRTIETASAFVEKMEAEKAELLKRAAELETRIDYYNDKIENWVEPIRTRGVEKDPLVQELVSLTGLEKKALNKLSIKQLEILKVKFQ